ncbi:MAG: hypothetical protein WEC75_14535 [Dehalococcoidia bacterium]
MRWNIIVPVGLFAAALLGIAWFDLTADSDAEPAAYLGAVGTPVRGTFVAPTRPPPGVTPSPRPRPTIAGASGTAEERDGRRKADLLTLAYGFNSLRDAEGSFPTTNGNVQTLCAFKDLDVGCSVEEYVRVEPPEDPLGDPIQNGYWYSSDGQSMRVYASLEEEVPEGERCETEDANLRDKPNLICIELP